MKTRIIIVLSIVGVLGTASAAMAVNAGTLASFNQTPIGSNTKVLDPASTLEPVDSSTVAPKPFETEGPTTTVSTTPEPRDNATEPTKSTPTPAPTRSGDDHGDNHGDDHGDRGKSDD